MLHQLLKINKSMTRRVKGVLKEISDISQLLERSQSIQMSKHQPHALVSLEEFSKTKDLLKDYKLEVVHV